MSAHGARGYDGSVTAERGADPDDDALFEAERLRLNLSRLRLGILLGLVTHPAHVVAFLASRPTVEVAAVAGWRNGILLAHALMAGFDLVVAALLWGSARAPRLARPLPTAFFVAYVALGAVLTSLDQAVTSDISPWLLITFAVTAFFRLSPRPALAALLGGYGLYLAGQWTMQPDAALRLSNSVKGLSITVMAFGLSLAFGRHQRREFDQRRIIERQRAELEVALAAATQAAAEADRANRAKSTFLATVSHEIRTPMTGVLGVTDLLARTRLDASQRQLVRTVQDSGQTLMALVDDLLDLSKAEAGQLRLETVPVDVAGEVERVARLFEPRAQAKGLALEVRWLSPRPPLLLGDPLRLRQVLSNLVGNALKFTAVGRVELRCHAELSGDRSALRLEVVDTGAGIAPEVLAHLFTPYAQADASVARAHGGTGLGLAISRQLAEAMGGRLEAESALGEGSTFRLSVALSPAPPRGLVSVSQPPLPLPRTHVGRVLLADDNSVNQLVLRAMLKKLGLEVEVVGDGAKALARLDAERFDLLLTDFQMPEMDGLELVRRLRAKDGGGPRLPAVVLSGGLSEEERLACVEAGADALLLKPVRLDALAEALAPFLSVEPPPSQELAEPLSRSRPGLSAPPPASRPG